MLAPARYEVDLAAGTAEPLPWYLPYIRAGQYYGCPPWELIDDPTPRRFWLQAGLLVASAEAEAREKRDELERIKREAREHAATKRR